MKGIEPGPLPLITLKEYEEINKGSDKNPDKEPSGLRLPLVGLFGEAGSLITLFKKKWRDANAYKRLSEDLIEEFGDLLWYVTNVSNRCGLSLDVICREAFPELRDFKPAKGLAFSDIDRLVEDKNKVDSDDIVTSAAKLGEISSKILFAYESKANIAEKIQPFLVSIFGVLLEIRAITGVSFEDAAAQNIAKTSNRWPIKEPHIALFDAEFGEHEQLPRDFVVEFQEIALREKIFVYQKFNGVHVGDRLTDNIIDPDFYRFHDAFHWGYAAILGWSPVTRSLLRLKRKTNPTVDENQDGARAAIIEETISVWIFHQAKEMDYFENIDSLEFRILKGVSDLTKGFEAETLPLWLWERAILDGYKVFRELKKHRKGFVVGNLLKRSVEFSLETPPSA